MKSDDYREVGEVLLPRKTRHFSGDVALIAAFRTDAAHCHALAAGRMPGAGSFGPAPGSEAAGRADAAAGGDDRQDCCENWSPG